MVYFGSTGFRFIKIFDRNCLFYVFILFPCRIIAILTSPIRERHCRKKAQRWKKRIWICYLFLLNSLCFWAETQLSRKILWVFLFCLCLCSFSLLYAIYPKTTDCFPEAYHSIQLKMSVFS